ncbi:Hypothetical_protein [Hexamita inflata]|uniref:Hypothetical_protein n=1 Tax=Hexamita inflata TaxID=28002 RepID=A0AA86UZF5_9EUKA|nr:Hypothetical protein HINF_LOCUS58156 [Hexamita inflata]
MQNNHKTFFLPVQKLYSPEYKSLPARKFLPVQKIESPGSSCSLLQTQKLYALPLIRQSQDSYQPSKDSYKDNFQSTMLVQVPNQLRLSEEAIQSDNPRR